MRTTFKLVMGRKTKIEQVGTKAELIVHQERAKGESLRDIADTLNKQFDIDITHNAVQGYLKNTHGTRLAELGADNVEHLRREEFKKILDVEDQLDELNQKLKDAIDELDTTDRQDMGYLIKLSQEIRQQLKFHQEYIEQVTTPNTQVNNIEVNKTQQAIKITNRLKDLENEGVIEIKKPEKLGSTL